MVVAIVGQLITGGLAATCFWCLRRDRLMFGDQTLAYVCLVLAAVLVPVGLVCASAAPVKGPRQLPALSESALVGAMREGQVSEVYVTEPSGGASGNANSLWLIRTRSAGWEEAVISGALETSVGASFLRSPNVVLLTSVPTAVTDRLGTSGSFSLAGLWWIVFVSAVACGVIGLVRSRRLLFLRHDIDKGLRELLDEAGR